MISDLAVRRPIFAAVGAVILCVLGFAAFLALPVRELPNVDPPTVSISTNYTGASAEVIENRITEVIERQIAGIQGVDRITSSSRDGRSQINIQFLLDRDLDAAANDVRDAVSRVSAQLPEQATAPQVAKADADAGNIITLSLRSSTLNRLQLTDYAQRFLVERMSTVPGVAQVNIMGEQRYAMRIWLDADQLASRGLTVQDVEAALQTQNAELPAGYLESADKDFTIRVARGYSRPEDFAQLPIVARLATTPAGYVTRLGDVARVEEAAAESRRVMRSNGVERLGIGVTRQSQANDLEISEGVTALLEEIRPQLPPGTLLEIEFDNSAFTKEAIHEVWITIGIALALVGLVNIVFLGSWRAALIPTVVAPICLVSSFMVLAALGFSLNLLTLLAMVLAIGLVVDDAIVVTENIQRRIDAGEPPVIAAERGARQVFFAVVATTIVLISVFAPMMFLPGYLGRLFIELAAAIVAAIVFSAFLALTLSPMLASKILRPSTGQGPMARVVDRAVNAVKASYRHSLHELLGRRRGPIVAGGLTALAAGAGAFLYLQLPQELVPPEDRGRIFVSVQAPVGAGFDYTLKQALQLEPVFERYREAGEIKEYVVSVPGFGGGFNSASAPLTLTETKHRRHNDEIAAELNKEFNGITGARVTANVPPALQRGGGGNNVEFIVSGPDYESLVTWIEPILEAARNNPGMVRPRIDYEPNAPRLSVDIDRDQAAAMAVSAADVGRALEAMFGSRRATTYIRDGYEYDVLLQTERDERRTVQDLESLYVRGSRGELVPLASVVTTEVKGDTPERRRVNRLRAVSLTMQLNPGYTVADAVDFLKAEAAKQPRGPIVQWGGTARDFLEASGGANLAFAMALVLVFLVLAAQFESWISPAVIMLTVPLAALGGLFGLFMADDSLNIYSQIGLIILVGVAAKNGILIVEFANQLRDEGLAVREAVIEAATLRLRPIVMTSIATAFGALPLMLWEGAGASSRQAIGVVVFTGAIFSTMLTLFVVPIFYNALGRFTKSPEWITRWIEAYERQHGEGFSDAHAKPAE